MGRFKVAVADFTSFRLAALTALLGCALMSGGAKSALASTGPLTAPKTTFATQPVYTASGPRAITITNAGPDSVPIKQVFPETTQPVPNFPVDAFFLASDGCTGVTLAPGHTCQVSVDFDPQSTGSITRSLDVSTDCIAYFFALSGSGSSVVSNPGHPVPHIIAPASYLGGIPVRVTWTAELDQQRLLRTTRELLAERLGHNHRDKSAVKERDHPRRDQRRGLGHRMARKRQ